MDIQNFSHSSLLKITRIYFLHKYCKNYTNVVSVQENQFLLILLFHFLYVLNWNTENEYLNSSVADNSKVKFSNAKHIAQLNAFWCWKCFCLYWTGYMRLIYVDTFVGNWLYCSHLVYKGSFNLYTSKKQMQDGIWYGKLI